jgi:hypothetical protein
MADTPERKRPNANYPLTVKKNSDEEPVFYYSREARLAKAPKSVQALYGEGPKKKLGFFRSLTATKPLASIFTSIIFLCAAILLISIFGLAEGSYILGGNQVSLSAMKFQEETIIILEKTFKEHQEAYTGVVDIGISPAALTGNEAAELPVFTHRVFFSLAPKEEYRFSVPFAADELAVVLLGEADSVSFKVQVK